MDVDLADVDSPTAQRKKKLAKGIGPTGRNLSNVHLWCIHGDWGAGLYTTSLTQDIQQSQNKLKSYIGVAQLPIVIIITYWYC